MWQQVALIVTGMLVLAYIGYRIYSLLKRTKQKNNPCIGCTGCNLYNYNQIKSKKDCPEEKK